MPTDLLALITSLGLVAAAEMGDKSQLVCMSLASRHRGLPVLLGAVAAFAVLNLLAVVLGAQVARWLPEWLVAAAVATLFLTFAVINWRQAAHPPEAEAVPRPAHGVFLSTFGLIFLAEFGDKTQLAVAGLASTQPPLAVWLGATLGLGLTTLMGVVAGRTVLQRLPLTWIHRLSALLFLILGLYAGYRALTSLPL